MHLRNEKAIGLNYIVKAVDGKELFLVEVIALILKFLKERLLMEHEQSGVQSYKATDFDWVITVPAIWKDRGKQMMREAAYMAGLTSDWKGQEIQKVTNIKRSDGILTTAPKLTYDELHPPNPEMLSLAYEPESAAIHCMDIAKKKGISFDQSKCYMVLDIGGGTADITAYKLNASGAIEVILTPQGNNWGGTTVNNEFKKFLGKLAEDPDFHQYLSTSDEESNAKNGADLDEIVNLKFEDAKRFFGDTGVSDAEAIIRLPFKFMMTYNEALKRRVAALDDKRVTLFENELRISYAKMEEFFSHTIQQLQSCMMRSLNKCPTIVDTVFFVGGFGGCKYLYDTLERAIMDQYNSSCTTFRPLEYQLAVVSGAIKFRQDPSVVRSRVADATYGTECVMKFNTKLHDKVYEDDNYCKHLFVPYVHEGDVIECDKLVVSTFVPGSHAQKAMEFAIYTSPRRNIKYARKSDGKPLDDVHKVGALKVEMPNATGDTSRQVKLTFDFSHTEIQVQAYDFTSGEKTTTVVNFLTDFES